MNYAANFIAVVMLTIVPYLRPCDCGNFNLFCDCPTVQAAQAEKQPMPDAKPMCEHCKPAAATTQTNQQQPKHEHKKPCKQPLAPQLDNGALVQSTPVSTVTPNISAVIQIATPQLPRIAHEVRVATPRAPPDPVGLIVARTTFLLV